MKIENMQSIYEQSGEMIRMLSNARDEYMEAYIRILQLSGQCLEWDYEDFSPYYERVHRNHSSADEVCESVGGMIAALKELKERMEELDLRLRSEETK